MRNYSHSCSFTRGIRTIGVDEKTGIQALERSRPDKLSIPGSVAKVEFEYKRHGTQALIPCFDVATGEIISYRIGDTRTEVDFAAIIIETIEQDSEVEWVFIADPVKHAQIGSVGLVDRQSDRLRGRFGSEG